MNISKKAGLSGLVLLAVMSVSASVSALEKGDKFIHLRAINVNPDDSSSTLKVDGTSLAGTGVTDDDSNTVDISVGYMVTDNLAIELLADLSSQHDVSVFGLPASLNVPDGTKVLDSRVLPPTLFIQYQFSPKSSIRPYAGLGLNYTLFFDEELTPAAKSALGASNLDLDSSVGIAAQVGLDYALQNNWSINLDVKYIEINTEATFDSALGPVSVDVDINPWVFGIGIGKTF